MSTRKKHLVALCACFLLLAGAVLWYGWTHIDELIPSEWVTGFDRRLEKAFRALEPGMSRPEVVRRMGEPGEESKEFPLGQYQGFEKEYEEASRNTSKYFLFWRNGIDIVYAVGFDVHDRLVLTASGGT